MTYERARAEALRIFQRQTGRREPTSTYGMRHVSYMTGALMRGEPPAVRRPYWSHLELGPDGSGVSGSLHAADQRPTRRPRAPADAGLGLRGSKKK
jgi:hypothetical protein